ncbi:MAG: hypothetical protein WC438_03955 [Candidatus Pacearchaeota archaeon]
MNKFAKSESIFVGVLIFVIGGVILYLLFGIGGGPSGGILNHPNPILTAQGQDEVCPSSIYFDYDGEGEFNINLRNSGAEGSIFVTIFSPNITSRGKPMEEFNNTSTKLWNVPSGNYQDFNFDLNRTNNRQQNFTIYVKYGCSGLLCSDNNFICDYASQSASSNQYYLTK